MYRYIAKSAKCRNQVILRTVNGRLTEVNEPAAPSARADRCMRCAVASMRVWVDRPRGRHCCQIQPSARDRAILLLFFFFLSTSFSVLPASYRVMSTVAGTSDGAGADETTIFSPEQLALIDHLITNRVATASGESASTSATPGVPPSAAFGKCPVRPGSGHSRP